MNKHKSQSKREARRQRRYDAMIKHCPTEALEKFKKESYQVRKEESRNLDSEV